MKTKQAFGKHLPERLFEEAAREHGCRNRFFNFAVTFWTFLYQVLSPQCSCREAVRKVQAWHRQQAGVAGAVVPGSTANSGYCQARARLPLELIKRLLGHLLACIESRIEPEQLWLGERRVKIADGTTLSMPDTPANQKEWPQSSAQKPGCGFPIMKVMGIFCLASGALLNAAFSNKHEHDVSLFRRLWNTLSAGDVVLNDRGLCSFSAIALLLTRKVDSVMRLHQARKVNWRKGKRLGHLDRLITWKHPQKPPRWLSEEEYAALPGELTLRILRFPVKVRGFRTREVILVTTLIDAKAYPAEILAELYLSRWRVELHFRELKTVLAMDTLRCLSPEMVEKEFWLHVIAYNLVRCVMQEAARRYRAELQSLSFKGCLDTMRQWADPLHSVRNHPRIQAALFDQMLALLARDTLPYRPNRSEPRAKKRRPKNYQLLNKSRRKMGKLPHRNRAGNKRSITTLS